MKGGYQILDLSTVTVGTKTKSKGSFEQAKGNNGKPVMVLTPDNQRVFAEVVESSGDYILAYLGGDGSTYTVLVEDDDNVTITKQESDASIATKVSALETAVGDVTDLETTSKEVVGAINELNGLFTPKSVNVTGTTDSYGLLPLSTNDVPMSAIILQVQDGTTGTYFGFPFQYGDHYTLKCVVRNTLETVSNTEITFTIKYLDL